MWAFIGVVVVLCISLKTGLSSDCANYQNCVDCTKFSRFCSWAVSSKHPNESGCFKKHILSEDSSFKVYDFDDTCPAEYATNSTFLSNWMKELFPIIKNLTLLDLSLPGTHDTLTHDLSTTVSEGGMDDALVLAEILHNYTTIVPNGIEDFIRQQAQTQDMDVFQQLDAGIRFFDFRMMMEYTDSAEPWYSLHMVQSMDLASVYYQQIRQWMDAHPSEIVVLWVSKHGNTCATGEDQYPNVSPNQKQAYWKTITDIFDGVLTDFTVTKINETSINTMLERNHRIVLYMSDYSEMTADSPYALDGCLVDNDCSDPGAFHTGEAVPAQRELYAKASARKSEDKKEQKFYLVSLASGGTVEQIVASAILNFVPPSDNRDLSEVVKKCADNFNIPNMTWCPETLLDIAQLESYYNQIAMDEILIHDDWTLPNGIYLNGLDRDGTIRTGTQVLWGGIRNEEDVEHWTTAYAYVDTFIAVNIRDACGSLEAQQAKGITKQCDNLISTVNDRRAKYPLLTWSDAAHGRSTTWPDEQ